MKVAQQSILNNFRVDTLIVTGMAVSRFLWHKFVFFHLIRLVDASQKELAVAYNMIFKIPEESFSQTAPKRVVSIKLSSVHNKNFFCFPHTVFVIDVFDYINVFNDTAYLSF